MTTITKKLTTIFESESSPNTGLYQKLLNESIAYYSNPNKNIKNLDKVVKTFHKTIKELAREFDNIYKEDIDLRKCVDMFLNGPEGSTSILALVSKLTTVPLPNIPKETNRCKIIKWLLNHSEPPDIKSVSFAIKKDSNKLTQKDPTTIGLFLINYANNPTASTASIEELIENLYSIFPLKTKDEYSRKKNMDYSNWVFPEVSIKPPSIVSPLAILSESEFSNLSKRSRQWLLYNKKASSLFLTKEFQGRLYNFFESSPPKPEFGKHKNAITNHTLLNDKKEILGGIKTRLPELLSLLEKGEFETINAKKLFANPLLPYFKEEIQTALLNYKETTYHRYGYGKQLDINFLQGNESNWSPSLLSIFKFYSVPKEKRILEMAKFRKKDLDSFLNLIPAENLSTAVYRINGEPFQKDPTILPKIFKNKRIKALLISDDADIASLWGDKILSLLPKKKILQFLTKNTRLINKVSPENFLDCFWKWGYLTKLNDKLLYEFLDGIKNNELTPLRTNPELHSVFIALLKTNFDADPDVYNIPQFLAAKQWLLEGSLVVSNRLYSAITKKTSLKSKLGVKLKNASGVEHILSEEIGTEEDFLDIKKCIKKYNPKILKPLQEKFLNKIFSREILTEEDFKITGDCINRYNPKILKQFKENFLERIYNNKTIRDRINLYLSGELRFQSVGYSWEILKSLIPKIYESHKTKPLLASAYTLAITYSPWDTKFFKAVAIKIMNNKEKKGQLLTNLYEVKTIPKKDGSSRAIHSPLPNLKRIQRNLIDYGFYNIKLEDCVHGFRPNRSILTNAKEHTGKPIVTNIDIESFFTNCTYKLIKKACSKIVDKKYCPMGGEILAEICSYEGMLPTGSPSSPVIGNIILQQVDKAVDKSCKRYSITYTRYGDDLSFSGSENTLKVIPFVKMVLEKLGFKIKEKKTNVYRRGRRQLVTGLTVNQSAHVPRSTRRNLRVAAYHWKKKGKAHWKNKPLSLDELKGKIAFVGLTHKSLSKKLNEGL